MTSAPAGLAPAHVSRPGLVPWLVALVFFMQLLDGTIIATSLPAMAADFGVEPVAVSTGITAYLLALAAVLPAAGWMGTRWGARRVLVASVTLFTLASLACAASPTLGAFVAARVVQGAAAALMAPVGRMLVLGHAPKSELMAAIATITWPALLAPVAGPVLGAWITATWGWQWNFLINLPLGAAAIALFLLLVADQDATEATPFDARGFALAALALVGALGGLELLLNGTDARLGIAALLVGVLLAAAGLHHLRRARDPLLDLTVLRVPSFRLATMTAGTLGRTCINATPFLLPLLFQVGWGLTALASGRLVLVYFLGNLLMKSVTTPVLRAWGFRRVVVANGLAATASAGAFAVVGAGQPEALLWGLLFVAGATRSLQFTALNTLAFAEIEAGQRAAATTLSSMTQQVSQLLGVALSVALIRAAERARGADEAGLADIRVAVLGMAVLGVVSALTLLRLHRDAGSEVTGRAG